MKFQKLPYWTIVVFFNVLGFHGFGQEITEGKIATAMMNFLAQEQVRYAATSFTVLDAKTGAEIYQYNGDLGLAPASTLKTMTSVAGYSLLGKDYTYKTNLLYDGEIRNDTLFGNLFIKGSGDPSFGSWRYKETKPDLILKKWVDAVRENGIKYVGGQIIGDDTVFDSQGVPGGWTWEDIGNYYGAGSSGLAWHENQYDLILSPGQREGDPVEISRTQPVMDHLYFTNELTTGAVNSGDQVYIYAGPYSNLAFVRGTAPANHREFKVSGSIPDPSLMVATEFEKALLKHEIRTEIPATTVRLLKMKGSKFVERPTKVLLTHESPHFSELSHWFLKKSINLYGEHFLKTLAIEEGVKADTENGLDKFIAFWEAQGIDSEALHIMDGSGLSPSNRTTTRVLAKTLVVAQNADWFDDFYDNLPVIHNIRMKSGHINRVAAYNGYLKDASGRPLVFSFMINNYSGKLRTLTPKIFRLLDELKR